MANRSVIEIEFLGTGTSTGVPLIGCDCAVCSSTHPRNKRLRSSVLIRYADQTVLIDSSADLRQQALRSGLKHIDAVVYTHAHLDHVTGFDDLRAFCWQKSHLLPMYASEQTAQSLQRMFPWAFDTALHSASYVRPELHLIDQHFNIGPAGWQRLRVEHGNVCTSGFIITHAGCKIAYIPDVKSIDEQDLQHLHSLDCLIIDGLRHRPHPTHMHVEAALQLINTLQPKQAWLTHLAHELDYCSTQAELPSSINLAFDTLRVHINKADPGLI